MRVDETRLTATYMLASRKHGTLYLGSALDLIVRVYEHKEGIGSRFTAKYGVTRLVWYESFMLVTEARGREYEMKKWRRDWKVNLIERDNPNWDDLYPVLIGAALPKPRHPRIREAKSGAHRLQRFVIMGPGLGLRPIREWVVVLLGWVYRRQVGERTCVFLYRL